MIKIINFITNKKIEKEFNTKVEKTEDNEIKLIKK